MKRLIAIVLLSIAACKSAPPSTPDNQATKPLVERTELTTLDPDDTSLCATARWTDAMACEDEGCVADAAGAQCVACVKEVNACIDGRSSGCADLCVPCLGGRRCAELDNLAVAAAHLTPSPHRGYTGGAEVVHRVGLRSSGIVDAITPDDLVLFTPFDEKALRYGNEVSELLLVDRDGRALRVQESSCGMTASPGGTWLIEQCEGQTSLYEGRTGFRRGELALSADVRLDRSASFGGERWLVVRPERGRWVRFDLLTGGQTTLDGVDDYAEDVQISPDGTRLAKSGEVVVWEIGSRQTPLYAPDEVGDVRWIDDATLLVESQGGTRIVAVPEGRVVRELQSPTWDDELQIRWELTVSRGEVFYVGRGPQGLKLSFGDGIEQDIPLVSGEYGIVNVSAKRAVRLPLPQAAAKLSDGSFYMTSMMGPVIWHPDDGIQQGGLLRGSVLWTNAGEGNELLVGTAGSAASVDTSSGAVTTLDLPIDFRLIDVRRAHGHLVAIGSKLGEEGTTYSRQILIVDPSGKRRTIEHELDPVGATMDGDGRLHVMDEVGLRTYSAAAEPKIQRTTKHSGSSLVSQEGPPRALPSQGLLSADGSFALLFSMSARNVHMLQGAKPKPTRLVRTADHKVLRTWDAISCATAARTQVYACVEPRDDGEFDLVSYDGTEQIAAMALGLNAVDITAVSDDGTRVVLGDPWFRSSSIGVVDLERGSTTQLEPGHSLSFTADGRLISFDGTYPQLFEDPPEPARLN